MNMESYLLFYLVLSIQLRLYCVKKLILINQTVGPFLWQSKHANVSGKETLVGRALSEVQS